nr:unnamed protein product [Callosobruchus chinensis]
MPDKHPYSSNTARCYGKQEKASAGGKCSTTVAAAATAAICPEPRAQSPEPIPKWKVNEANWQEYSNYIESTFWKVTFDDDINFTVNSFNRVITEAADVTIGVISIQEVKRSDVAKNITTYLHLDVLNQAKWYVTLSALRWREGIERSLVARQQSMVLDEGGQHLLGLEISFSSLNLPIDIGEFVPKETKWIEQAETSIALDSLYYSAICHLARGVKENRKLVVELRIDDRIRMKGASAETKLIFPRQGVMFMVEET